MFGAFVLFPLQMFGAVFFFDWLTIRARSFWPAALAHGAVNSIRQGVVGNLQGPVIYADVLNTALVFGLGLVCWVALRPGPEPGNLDGHSRSPAIAHLRQVAA